MKNRKEYYRKYSQEYNKRYSERQRTRTELRRRKNKKWLVEIKGGKCRKCGYDKCMAALEFHEPNNKYHEKIGHHLNWSREKLFKEVGALILLCANCHREIHFRELTKIYNKT